MWSEPSAQAVRLPASARVSSFWDDAPVTAPDTSVTTHFVRTASPVPPSSVVPPATERASEEESTRPSFAELEREAFMKGYAQGERSGAEAAARRGEATLRRLAQTVEELAGLRTELVRKTERQVVELAVAIAGRILRREVAVDRELLVTMARLAIERLGENTSATIRLNPDDYAFIGAKVPVGEHSMLRVVADPLVSSGGCLVQSDFGLIDASIDAQLGEMASSLGIHAKADDDLQAGRGAA